MTGKTRDGEGRRVLLLVASLHRGGVETHVTSLATALAEQGWAVAVASAGGALTETLEAAGIPHYTVPLCRATPWGWLRARRGLGRLLKREPFDLLHAHSRLAALVGEGAARRAGIPLVTTVHARFRTNSLARRLSRWGRETVAVSQDLKQYLCVSYGVPSERITVIPNGIDTARFCPAHPLREREDRLRVVFFSRLDRDSSAGAFLLCRIAERLSERFPTVEILLAGGGECLFALRREAESVNRRVGRPLLQLAGHLPHPEGLLREATLLVGVSRCALEAMACGIPVVLCGNEGFLGSAEASLQAAEECNFTCRGAALATEESLYEAVSGLLSLSCEERQDMGWRMRNYVLTRHSLTYVAEQTEQVYLRALEEAREAKKQQGAVALCGYYGFGNTGDEALLRSSVCRARAAFPGRGVVALTRRGRKDESAFGVRCVRRSSFFAVRRTLRASSALVFGGGTLLQEQTSLRSLLYYTALLRYARRRGIPTELWGNGLGPPCTRLGRALTVKALGGCRHIGLRDEPSLRLAKSLLAEAKAGSVAICREEDLALGTEPCNSERLAYLLEFLGVGRDDFAVVAPRGSEERGMLRLFCEWVATLPREGLTLVFLPMFPEEDRKICHALAEAMGEDFSKRKEGRSPCRAVVAEGLGASDLVGLMKKSRIVCGMRLHALIFAASAGVPFAGFGADSKVEAFCREHGGVYFIDLYG